MDYENSYFQDEYISEGQYISYNDEDNYDYGNNLLGDGENSEELGYEEDFGEGVEGEELGDGEGYRDWEEEVGNEG